MSVDEYRDALALATGHGWGFLAADGLTWTAAAVAWRRWGRRIGAYVTLLQGLVALPVALLVTAVTVGSDRPDLAGMDSVSVFLAVGQVLGLPIVISLVTRGKFEQVPTAMVLLVAVHFAPYSWLYATPLYLVMGAAVAVGSVLADASARRDGAPETACDAVAAERICLSTGAVMLASAAAALAL